MQLMYNLYICIIHLILVVVFAEKIESVDEGSYNTFIEKKEV